MTHSHTDFLTGLPKAELHLHLEGTLEPELMFELAKRNGIELQYGSPQEIREAYKFRNLQDFLDLYFDGCRVMVTDQDFYDVTRAYLERAAADGVRYAEITNSPQVHLANGRDWPTIMNGMLAAMEDSRGDLGIDSALIVGADRLLPAENSLALIDAIQPWGDKVLGFGLGGAEIGNPPAKLAEYYAEAKRQGFHTTMHSGEEGPVEWVRESVEVLGVERVDHGNSSMESPELVASLAAAKVPLTVCPVSNLKLQVVKDFTKHPIRSMLASGLNVSVNSDDPSYFGAYVAENFVRLHEETGLTDAEAATLARNSIDGSFASAEVKAKLAATLEEYLTAPA